MNKEDRKQLPTLIKALEFSLIVAVLRLYLGMPASQTELNIGRFGVSLQSDTWQKLPCGRR